MAFELIPAIDIRGGKCVRLYQGDFAQETVFSDDPVSVAQRWEDCGARRIHVVDLDGAASGKPANSVTIGRIAASVSIPIQVGGGLRTLEAIAEVLATGVDRVVLGTAAAENPDLVARAVERIGERLIVGIDARGGMVATHGWKTVQPMRAADLLKQIAGMGVVRVIYTDIARDGAMTGPNFASLLEMAGLTSIRVIASGGVSNLDQIIRLATMGLDGVIVGRAIYTGAVDLRGALAALAREQKHVD